MSGSGHGQPPVEFNFIEASYGGESRGFAEARNISSGPER
jgi:hypothetical protein